MTASRSLSAWCVDHPVATVLLTFALVLVGLIAFPRLPIAPLPEAEFPTIQDGRPVEKTATGLRQLYRRWRGAVCLAIADGRLP